MPTTSHPVTSPARTPQVTRWSMVLAAAGDDPAAREALGWLFRQYWPVLVAHVQRRGWRDADDRVQDFFAHLLQRGSLAQVDRHRGRFRSWLFTCLDHHLANYAEAQAAQCRGGGVPHEPLREEVAESPAVAFDRAWALAVLAEAQGRLAQEATTPDQRRRLEVLQPFLAAPGDQAAYAAAGSTLGIPEGAAKVAVHRLRGRFRAQVEAVIAETLESTDPAAIAQELDDLLAALQSGR